jgi:hypothetical protein
MFTELDLSICHKGGKGKLVMKGCVKKGTVLEGE